MSAMDRCVQCQDAVSEEEGFENSHGSVLCDGCYSELASSGGAATTITSVHKCAGLVDSPRLEHLRIA
jgi:hypothetical protein